MLVCFEGLHAEHRAKDLCGHDLAVGGGVLDQGRPEEQATELGVWLTTHDDVCAFGLGSVDKALDAVEVHLVNLRADIRVLISWIALRDLASAFDELGCELVGDRLVNQDSGAREADLTGVVILFDCELCG